MFLISVVGLKSIFGKTNYNEKLIFLFCRKVESMCHCFEVLPSDSSCANKMSTFNLSLQ